MSFDFSGLGSFLGGLVGAGASMISSRQQYHYQRALQEQSAQLNYDYGQKSLLNSPSSTRQGLENAGYNPMLAVQNATSGANAGWTSTGQANGTDYASGISQLVSNAQNMQRVKNETEQTQSVNDLNYAQADKVKAEKASIMEKLPFISQREKAEIGNIEKDSLKKEAEIHNIEETTRYIEKNYELQKRLGEMGINAQIYGSNKAYNASTYGANMAYKANSIKTVSQYFGKYMDDSIKKYGSKIGNFLNNLQFSKDIKKYSKYFKR